MKKILLLAILVQTFNLSFAQFGEGSKETIELWKNKTLVVLQYPNSELYNEVVSAVAKERWYNDKVEYVQYSNRENLKKRDDIVVLSVKRWFDYDIPVICFTTHINGLFDYTFSFKNDGYAYNNVQAENDDTWVKWKNDSKIIENSTVAKGLIILNRSSKERIRLMVDILFNTTDKFKDGEYKFKNVKKDNILYNTPENLTILKSKTLLVEPKCLPTSKSSKKLLDVNYFQSLYKGKIKLVTEEELAEAIKNRANDVVYLHLSWEVSFPTVYFVDISERKIIYCIQERTEPGDASPVKIFEIILKSILP